MALSVGTVVELVKDVTVADGALGMKVNTVGTTGVVLKAPRRLLRSRYKVRLDPDGTEVNLPQSALKQSAARRC